MHSLAFATVRELDAAIASRRLSPVELLKDVVRRLEALEPRLNMFAHRDLDGARADAQAAETRQMRGERRSPLDGIPTSIKDLIAQKGLPQRFGSRASGDQPAPVDAPSVERLRAAGAVLLGKSTTSEFGCKAVGDSPLTGITRNPWNTELTPGGSSAGAAAMVAAGLVPYAIGTDGGGSIRIPASLCGLFGIKGQFGRVPVYPVSATPTLAHVGPLTRTVQDAATVLGVIAGHDRRDPFAVAEPVPDFIAATAQSRRLKLAFSPTLGFARPNRTVLRLVAQAVSRIQAMGYAVDEVATVMDDPAPMWNAEFYAGVGTRLRGFIDQSPELLDPAVLELLRIAIRQDMDGYYKTVFARYAFREEMRKFFETYDLLLTPTLPVPAFPVGLGVPPELPDRNIVSWVYYTYPFNLTGQPAASLPIGFTDDGLPVGLQVVGRILGETDILSVCADYERHHGDLARRPPLADGTS